MMNRMPAPSDLTPVELAALREISKGFCSRGGAKSSITRLVELGLIQEVMGGLMITPAGRIAVRR